MATFLIVKHIVAWAIFLIAAIPAAWLFVLAIAALFPIRRKSFQQEAQLKLAIVVPAHNERHLIAETVKGLLEQDYPKEHFCVFVIADNCSDETAQLARDAGGRVLERTGNPGKGQGLFDAFQLLMQEDWQGFIVIDADTQAHPQLLQAYHRAFASGYGAAQAFYGVLNPKDSRRTVAMEFALASFNGLRPKGRAVLGLSAGIFGNGFGLRRDSLELVPYTAHSIVEDLEYHLRLVAADIRVAFLDQTWVKAQMPISAEAAKSQRVRWERGRMQMIREHVPHLLKGVLRGKFSAIEGLLEVAMPPVSALGMALVIAALLGDATLRWACLATVLALVFHYSLASFKYGRIAGLIQISFFIPWYIVWKSWIVATSFVKQRRLGWVRTKRNEEDG